VGSHSYRERMAGWLAGEVLKAYCHKAAAQKVGDMQKGHSCTAQLCALR
jgi:hypothetical protein